MVNLKALLEGFYPRALATFAAGVLVVSGSLTQQAAAVPPATIIGPIPSDAAGSGSRNAIHSASAIELAAHGYLEEEFFIEGVANNYKADPDDPMADASSYDIFSAVAQSIIRQGQALPAGAVDILTGLRARQIIATGHSQSASRLATYINGIHTLDPVFDGFIVHGGGGIIRDDQPVKIFKLMAETDMLRRAATPQPNTDNFRQWEVAGSSHVDVPFEIEYGKVRNQQEGLSIEGVTPRDSGCELPAYSTVPFRDVMNAAFEHMVRWIDGGLAPPIAEPIQLVRAFPTVEFARDELGNVLGGIRLAEHAVPTAKNTGLNTGANRFCFLYGSHEPFDAATLNALYPTKAAYLERVNAVVEQNVADGFILPAAAERTRREAEASTWFER